jgi:hypothetical protein
MPDAEVIAAVEALAAIAETHADQPWTVDWLRAHAEKIRSDDEFALLELRDRLVDLEQDLVVEHGDARARRIIAALQARLATTRGRRRPRAESAVLGAQPTYAPRRRDARLGLIAGALGSALIVIGLSAVLAGGACDSARRNAGIVLAVLGGAVGFITISLRTLEIRRQRHSGDDVSGDPILIIGVAQLFALVVTWLVVHQLGCTILGR